jgi:uncharacterized protein YdaU (DUF1376 family)
MNEGENSVADLTRFDFHALRFTQSDSISEMSNEEIGQYILLLCEAWLSQKGSLPDNSEVLARKARCKQVSEKVLAQFPLVETAWGPRRQNETLYAEWVKTNERMDIAKESGRKGGEAKAASRDTLGTLQAPYRPPKGIPKPPSRDTLPKTRPDQTDSNQTVPDQTSFENESFGQPLFKNIATRYSSYFVVHHSHTKIHKDRYYTACQKYGENRVLSFFDIWAKTNSWRKDSMDSNGLNFFWRPLEEMAEGDELRVAREQEQKKSDGPELTEKQAKQIITSSVSERQKEVSEQLRKIEEQKKWDAEHQDEI